ncbi:MAG: glycosyltransferase, partial [Clostridiales bacterium]
NDDSIKKVGFKSKNERIITTEDFENFKKIYKENENEVLNITKKERESAGKYLKSIGINKNDKYIFFDAGWNGSSQKYLENLFKSLDLNIDVEFLYLGIMRTEKSFRQLKNKIYKTFLFDSNNENDIAKTFKKSIIIAELFFSAPHNTVWRYWQKDNNFDVQYGSFDEKVWLQENMIKGAMDYIKFVNPIYEKISLDISPEDASAPLVRLIDSPNYKEAETIGDLYNLDSFAVEKGKKKYIAKTKLLTVIKNNSKDEIYWPQGVLYRRDSDFFTKLIVKNRYNLKRTSNFEVKSYRIIKKFDRYNYLLNRSKNVLKNEGMKSLTKKVYTKLSNRYIKGYNSKSDYDIWIEKKEKNISTKNVELKYNPLISVVIPVYNIKKEYLEECIDSVINQSYSNWELCVADDASTLPEVKKTLRKYEGRENIKIAYRETNGHIAKATNSALELATGDFVAFLDCDDKISKNALFEVANCINENPNIDFIYSDEDKLSENGKNRHSPYFKPDWSPDTFMSIMYTCHLGVYRRKIVNELGGIRGEFNGAQDYDMVLRFTEITNNIYHIPKILYHWREIKGSISASENAKPYAMEAMKKLKEEALKRRNLKGNIELVDDMAQYRVVYLPTNNPMVSIIIPTKNNPDTFLQCIDSINNITLYKNYEVILIDNGSTIENQNKYRELSDKYSCKYFFYDIPFNYSKINNFAVIKSSGDYLLFLNDDTEAIEDSWLERMLGHAMLTHVGAVGAKLYYPNSSTIQHIGITNLSIGPSHTLMSFDDSIVYYFGRNRLDCNCLAVTGACLMVKKQKFISVGKFDESLSIAYNDVDLCFRLHKNGYYNVIRNDVKLYHHESLSRGNDDVDLEKQRRLNNEKTILYKKHKDLMGKDVFYNINLTGRRVDFKIDLDDKLKKDNNLDIDFFEVGDDQIKASIDSIDISNNYLYIKGWAFRCDKSLDSFKIVILLKNKNEILNFDTEIEYRPDVSESFNKLNFKNLDKSGFSLNVFLGDNKFDDSYRIGIMVSTQIERKVLWLEKYVDIKK